MFRELYFENFKVILEKDLNLFDDVTRLREEYGNFDEDDSLTSVLEIIIVLAKRMYDILDYEKVDFKNWVQCFWHLIYISGLEKYDDTFFKNNNYREVYIWVDNFNNRTYHKNGVGGLFPIKGIKKDMRKADLWYQLNWYVNYLCDNYYKGE